MASDAAEALGSAAWCAAELARVDAADTGAAAAVDGRLSFTATVGPAGDVSWHLRLAQGRVVELAPGADADADASATLPWADAEAVFAGELDANAAFMQGRLKATGATGPLLAWLAAMKHRQA